MKSKTRTLRLAWQSLGVPDSEPVSPEPQTLNPKLKPQTVHKSPNLNHAEFDKSSHGPSTGI